MDARGVMLAMEVCGDPLPGGYGDRSPGDEACVTPGVSRGVPACRRLRASSLGLRMSETEKEDLGGGGAW